MGSERIVTQLLTLMGRPIVLNDGREATITEQVGAATFVVCAGDEHLTVGRAQFTLPPIPKRMRPTTWRDDDTSPVGDYWGVPAFTNKFAKQS